MPCNSDYMESTQFEKNLSTVYGLLDELKTGKLPKNFGSGYDSRVYGQNNIKLLDKKTEELCSKLKKTDVTKFSLEMQIWWRDHQIADKKRILEERKELKNKLNKEKTLSKLTSKEKKLLNL